MNNEKHYYEITDAFLALKDIDDDEIEGMLRESKKSREARIHEGKSFGIGAGSKDLDAARKFLDEDADAADEIEVIDVDADTVDHLKKNTEYVGQGILCCNRCKSNRFIDMDLLVASEVDEETFNIDDECPHCHDAGAGYALIGQVGKVQKAEPEAAVSDEAEATVQNDEIDAEAAKFDNDLEGEAEVQPEATEDENTEVEEEPTVTTVEEEPETDGMETNTSEAELDDLDLPELGDEFDQDDVDEDEDESVKEALNEEVHLNALAEEAWMMNRVISAMNNEDAYYGSWLYLWPDGETREECAYDFGDHESFEELKDKFIRTYKHYHADGLYAADPDVVEYAHMIDSRLGLAKIENLEAVKPQMRESFECSVAGDIFNAITSPEKVDKVVIFDISNEEDEPRKLFQGCKDDVPLNIVGSPCRSFDVADGYLSCNIDTDIKNTNRPLNKALECFNDEKTDKVLIWDQATGEEVFSGTKADACDKFGDCEFISFETPAVIRICVNNPGILSCDELEDAEAETDVGKLIKKIIDANNLSQYKTDKPNTNEYWIKTCIEENDDVELIYESFVKPTENKALITEFKAVTGYNNALEEAYEVGYAAAEALSEAYMNRAEIIDELKALGKGYYKFNDYTDAQLFRMLEKERSKKYRSVDPYEDERCCSNCGTRLNDGGTCPKCDDGEEQYESLSKPVTLDTVKAAVDAQESNPDAPDTDNDSNDVAGNAGNVTTESVTNTPKFKVGDELEYTGVMTGLHVQLEVTKVSDDTLVADEVWVAEDTGKTCREPRTFEIEKDNAGNDCIVVWEYHGEVGRVYPPAAKLTEKIRCFKSRKELAEAVQECKNNSRPYTIRRSTTEGFRYDLVEEASGAAPRSMMPQTDQADGSLDDMKAAVIDLTEDTNLVPAGSGEIEIVDDIPQEMPVEYSPEQRAMMDQIHRIALDTAEAIGRHYGIDADPAIIVADIIRDLQLISGDVSVDDLTDSVPDQLTRHMFDSYQAFYDVIDQMISAETGTDFITTPEMKIRQAIQMLHGPNFTRTAIDRAIGSRAFIQAARSGNIPYIAAADIPLLEECLDTKTFTEDVESGFCSKCGQDPCECLSEELEDLLAESVEVDTEAFDADMNEYFNEKYEDTVLYTTTHGHVNDDGTIVLEGMIQYEEVVKPITFTLNPETKIIEEVEDKEAAFADLMLETFTVTNNISEEVFEFKFSN